MSCAASALAALIGIPVGLALHLKRFRGGRAVGVLVNTGVGLPPVVVGLVVTLLLWADWLIGELRLLYTLAAMVFAQLLVALPLSPASPERRSICSTLTWFWR